MERYLAGNSCCRASLKGYIRQILFYAGPILNYEKIDAFTDYGGGFGFNMQFRNNWGYEIEFYAADSKDRGKRFTATNLSLNAWFNTSPKWHGYLNSGYSRTYNFARDYLAYYSLLGADLNWQVCDILEAGSSANIFIEGNPAGGIEEITFNTRPYFSTTPINNLNLRVYFDNLFFRSGKRLEQGILGFLFSYNFSPKSWLYFAVNEIRDRSDRYDMNGNLLPNRLHVVDRVSVFKLRYLYYF